MLIVYRAEVFNRGDFSPRSQAIIENPEITFDYLTLETTKIVCKSLDCEYGDWIRIMNQNGENVYSGIIENVVSNSRITEITIAPLQNLMNVKTTFQYNRQGLGYPSAEGLLIFAFYYLYLFSFDEYMRVPYVYNHPTTTESPKMPTSTEQLNNQWSIAQYVLKQSGVVMNMEIDVQNKNIIITNEAITNPVVVELDKDYVLDYELSDGSSQGFDSVAVYCGEVDGTHIVKNYCLHTDGTIDDDLSTDRYLPVRYTETTSQDGNDAEGVASSLAKATELLQNGKWVNEIKITISNDNKILSPNLPIGTQAIVLDGDVAYETILTGYVKKAETTTLLFGTIRSELTKQIAIEKISNGNAYASDNKTSGGVEEWSTDHETIVGKWVNGKPIYRKCAYRGNIGSGSTTMTFALDNPETIVFCGGCGNEGSGMSYAQYQLPYHNPVDTRYSLGMFYRSGAINFRGGTAVTIKNAYVWVDYTKTTDTATQSLSLEE